MVNSVLLKIHLINPATTAALQHGRSDSRLGVRLPAFHGAATLCDARKAGSSFTGRCGGPRRLASHGGVAGRASAIEARSYGGLPAGFHSLPWRLSNTRSDGRRQNRHGRQSGAKSVHNGSRLALWCCFFLAVDDHCLACHATGRPPERRTAMKTVSRRLRSCRLYLSLPAAGRARNIQLQLFEDCSVAQLHVALVRNRIPESGLV